MKNLPLIQRWRETSSGVVTPAEGRRPFRLWMTGSLAVVMAAMIPLRGALESERAQSLKLLRHSRYGVSETLQRIETAARDRGLSVLAKLAGDPPVLVLASAIGGTLVVMNRADSPPAMPLSLLVSKTRDGGADVLVAAAPTEEGISRDWSDLPPSVVDDLRALPGVVARALGDA